jgi:hypothetical protein
MVTINYIQVVSSNLIQVVFSGYIVNQTVIYTTSSYSLSGVDLTTYTPSIQSIKAYEDRLISFLFVQAQGLVYGKEYRLTISNSLLHEGDGTALTGLAKTFLMHRTKTDDVLLSLAKMYYKGVGSNLKTVLEAISMNDEKIGGDF